MEVRSSKTQLVFVDDDRSFQSFLSRSLAALGCDVVAAEHWEQAKLLMSSRRLRPDVIFVEPYARGGLPGQSLREIASEADPVPLVVFSSRNDPKSVVEAMRAGAQDYIVKSTDLTEAKLVIDKIVGEKSQTFKPKAKGKNKAQLVFSNAKMKQIHDTILQIADTEVSVLIQGESGVGKDIVARLLHQNSRLRNKPFVKVNCAALPGELVESELFGYQKGAFTGAYIDRPGKFQFANGGSIFLDEIGEFTPQVQAKLLQVLQDGRFTRLGSNEEIEVSVRVISATNRNLEEAIQKGTFREDLYYRLNVVNVEIPPLRQRMDEVPLLCEHFLEKIGKDFNGGPPPLPEELVNLFSCYQWPGNVRELENLLKRFVVLQDLDSIRAELETKISRQKVEEINDIAETYMLENEANLDLKEISRRATVIAEKNTIIKTLRKTNWNKWKAAEELKVSYKTLLTKIEQYGIKPSVLY